MDRKDLVVMLVAAATGRATAFFRAVRAIRTTDTFLTTLFSFYNITYSGGNND